MSERLAEVAERETCFNCPHPVHNGPCNGLYIYDRPGSPPGNARCFCRHHGALSETEMLKAEVSRLKGELEARWAQLHTADKYGDALELKLAAQTTEIEGLRKCLTLAKSALEANRANYLRMGDGFTFCSGCGEREPHCSEESQFPGAGNPTEIPHHATCPQRLLWDANSAIDAAIASEGKL